MSKVPRGFTIEQYHQTNNDSAGSIFSGLGSILGGLEHAGFKPIFVCENNPKCQEILHARFQNARLIKDITTFEDTDVLPVGVVEMGFPCNGTSKRGNREGMSNEETSSVKHAIRWLQLHLKYYGWLPTLIYENPLGALECYSGADGVKAPPVLSDVCACLINIGYVSVAQTIVSAIDYNMPQQRVRVIGIASNDFDAAMVIFADDAPPAKEQMPQPSVDQRPACIVFDAGEGTHIQRAGATPCITASNANRLVFLSEETFGVINKHGIELLFGFPSNYAGDDDGVFVYQAMGKSLPLPIAKHFGHQLYRVLVLNMKLKGFEASPKDPICGNSFEEFGLMAEPNARAQLLDRLVTGGRTGTAAVFTAKYTGTGLPKYCYYNNEAKWREYENPLKPTRRGNSGLKLEELGKYLKPADDATRRTIQLWATRITCNGLQMNSVLYELIARHRLMPLTCESITAHIIGIAMVPHPGLADISFPAVLLDSGAEFIPKAVAWSDCMYVCMYYSDLKAVDRPHYHLG